MTGHLACSSEGWNGLEKEAWYWGLVEAARGVLFLLVVNNFDIWTSSNSEMLCSIAWSSTLHRDFLPVQPYVTLLNGSVFNSKDRLTGQLSSIWIINSINSVIAIVRRKQTVTLPISTGLQPIILQVGVKGQQCSIILASYQCFIDSIQDWNQVSITNLDGPLT